MLIWISLQKEQKCFLVYTKKNHTHTKFNNGIEENSGIFQPVSSFPCTTRASNLDYCIVVLPLASKDASIPSQVTRA